MLETLEILLEETFTTVERAQSSVTRQLTFPSADNLIKVAIGMRRTGKSTFLYQTINQLLANGVKKEQILFINFEDERLLPMTAKEMGALLDSFYTLYPENHDRCCYLFLDEVQNIPDWQQVVRRFFDSKHIQLYLSGSSAKLLSTEIATSLRGRSITLEVWPFSFKEYVTAHQIPFPEKPFGQKAFDVLREACLNYFSTGGFPAVQTMPADAWRDTLQNYVDTVILRDIVERYQVSNINLLKYLTHSLLRNAATAFSVNKFYHDIKSQGYKISKDTLYTYLSYIEDAFLIFTVPFYTESIRISQNKPKKVYAIDNGLVNANALGTNAIYNKFLENQIYLDLRRAGKSVYYYQTKDNYEVDFVAVDKNGKRELIQVAYEMNDPATAEREQRALTQAEQELGIKGRIITFKDYLRSQLD